MTEILDSATVEKLTEEGRKLIDLISTDPAGRPDMDFGKAIQVISITRGALKYDIAAELPRRLDCCQTCGSTSLMKHGRYVLRLADLPYQEPSGFVMPVEYAISAQRYKCGHCGVGDVEPLPEALTPVLTSARITRRLSKWLLYIMQTQTPYEVIARMTGYSKVWARKWYAEARVAASLPGKPANKPGRRKKNESR
ncbi:hypothetical protein [Paracidovorax wautersii]|nr:hypothetical protein [Paracidovorax wautersii]